MGKEMETPAPVHRAARFPAGAHWITSAVLGSAIVLAIGFLVTFALPHLVPDERRAALYASRRVWLLLHIFGGTVTLLVGPVQLWLGLQRRRRGLHRKLGLTYIGGVAVGAMTAFYLALHTPFGLVFGMGLSGLGVAWIITTGLGLAAVRRGQIAQHQEWMIRSYVVTFAFVTFRLLMGLLEQAHVGTLPERLAVASWFCWAVPLLVTEAILQGGKIVATDAQMPARSYPLDTRVQPATVGTPRAPIAPD
jgi:uncharacterized membrane protein